jgi:ABC-type transporter Mla MlaB component
MATKSDRLGLLSKMAMFVRNPTKDWSDLERTEPSAESGYDKHALKAMIERKRQNDFVRRREFDQLRKLRSREASGVGGLARPSVFQTSMTTDQDGRAVTLKKIDEIEAQMSKQWWKGKQESAGAGGADFPVVKPLPPEDSQSVASGGSAHGAHGHFDTTQNAEYENDGAEFTETEMGAGMVHVSVHLPLAKARSAVASQLGALGDRYDAANVGFSTSELFAIEVDDMATDPELEEAAIRFANGDDTGAENGLLEALRGDAIQPEVARSWAAALLDFYRATNNATKFDQAVVECAGRLDRITPRWESIATAEAPRETLADVAPLNAAPASSGSASIWECPANLTLDAMENLREAMASQPMPWHLGWTRLSHISPDAMPLLAGLFNSLCGEPVTLRFSGAESLVQTLRAMLPAGDRSMNPAWWTVRLDVLRTMQLQDEFELAALDYCVTYEVSPPGWEPARCRFERVSGPVGTVASAAWDAGFSQAATVPMGLNRAPATAIELRGEVLGDATHALAGNGGGYDSGQLVIVACHGLVRVDFSAAGSILNWVAMRQSEGCSVQFQGVHRLVAAFFNVIGINEHARVVPRAI